jgi:peptidoglycan/LPS O-acetylase OafA/YrhL
MRSPIATSHRPDIDGLRAIAILSVLVFHLDESLLRGGFLGVDVFFVISGYLITSIIRREIGEERFSFGRFYERRIRRIMPAFLVVMLATTLAGLAVLLPADLITLAESLRYALLSAANFFFLGHTQDYFANQAAAEPLLHTWSLGVEEQFYLLFPLGLLGLPRWLKTSRHVTLAIVALLILSFAACLVRAQSNTADCFFLLPYRAWQMLAGALLAYQGSRITWSPRGAGAAGVLGLLLIGGSMGWVGGSSFYPGWAALAPCIGTALLLVAGAQPGSPAQRLLTCRPLVFTGLISYSVYLWHWPIIVLLKSRVASPSPALLVGAGAASLVLGWASWKWIENPFRRPDFLSRRTVFSLWAGASVVLLGVASAIVAADGFENRFSPEIRAMLAWKHKEPGIGQDVKKHWNPAKVYAFGDTSQTPTIALWGDSHANALVPWLETEALRQHRAVRLFTVPAQAPVPGVVVDKNNNEKRLNYSNEVLRILLADDKLRTVILHARWAYYLHGYNEESGVQNLRFYQRPEQSLPERGRYFADQLKQCVTQLLAAGKNVVLVYPVPEAGFNIPDYLVQTMVRDQPLPSSIPLPSFAERQTLPLAALDGVPDHPNLIRVRPASRLLQDGMLTIQTAGRSLYSDDDHLSTAGLDYIRDVLEPIGEAMRRSGPPN